MPRAPLKPEAHSVYQLVSVRDTYRQEARFFDTCPTKIEVCNDKRLSALTKETSKDLFTIHMCAYIIDKKLRPKKILKAKAMGQ